MHFFLLIQHFQRSKAWIDWLLWVVSDVEKKTYIVFIFKFRWCSPFTCKDLSDIKSIFQRFFYFDLLGCVLEKKVRLRKRARPIFKSCESLQTAVKFLRWFQLSV